MVSLLTALLCGVGGVTVAGTSWLVSLQDKLIYHPESRGREYRTTPDKLGLSYSDVWLTSSDGVRLHAWFIKHSPDCAGPTILYFQENAGNIGDRLVKVNMMMQNLECNVFMLSYRGYGASDGSPSQHGIIKDAQAALDYLLQRTDIDISRIVAYGCSLGGAVGAALTKDNPEKVAALMLENTFTSIPDMAGVLFPFLKCLFGSNNSSRAPKLLNFLVRSPWSTISVISEIKQPILFLSGTEDEMVPPSHMETLYAKAAVHNNQCLLVLFPTGHTDTWSDGGDLYWTTIKEFLGRTVPENI